VRFVYSPPWTSDRISPEGREALRTYGLTPPGHVAGPVFVPLATRGPAARATCPFCGSDDTELESPFGPTLCRSTHFCRACRNPFEAFKPKLHA
jgi:ring-1,2-phenylacetyl-CoA epoxidase subunit PaaD